jgi:AraC family transcriptional regulator
MVDAPPGMSEIRVVKQPAQRLHALRHRGPFATIPHTHRRLYLHAGCRTITGHWGASFRATDGPDRYRYYAALASCEPWPGGTEVELLDIPGGMYAVYRVSGPYARINAAARSLYARWLPGSGYEPEDRPMLEHYLNSSREVAQDQLRTDLLIPICAAGTR